MDNAKEHSLSGSTNTIQRSASMFSLQWIPIKQTPVHGNYIKLCTTTVTWTSGFLSVSM